MRSDYKKGLGETTRYGAAYDNHNVGLEFDRVVVQGVSA